MVFKLYIKDINGVTWQLPFKDFSINETLNKDRSVSITLSREDVEAVASNYNITGEFILKSGYREVYIHDKDDNVIYGGYISDLYRSGGAEDSGGFTIASKGFFNLFAKRFTDDEEAYSSSDLSNIAWGLINTSQSLTYGDFGITRGANPTTRNADRTYNYKNIKDAIEGLSNERVANGVDFDIDNDKVFNVYYPEKGTKRNNIILKRGFNVKYYTIRTILIDSLVNQIYVFGGGYGEGSQVVTRNAEDTYKSNYFLLQETLSEKDVTVTATLEDKGDAELERRKYPHDLITIGCDYESPAYTDYNLGDRLKVEIEEDNIDNFYRVVNRTLDHKGNVTLSFFSI